jgi:hypothetical protein
MAEGIQVYFRGADCNTNHCLVVAGVRVRPLASKQKTQKFEMQRFTHKNLTMWKLQNRN